MVSVVDTTSLISAGINKSTSLLKNCSTQRCDLIQKAYKSDDRLPLRSNAVRWSCTHARTHTHCRSLYNNTRIYGYKGITTD